MLNNILLAIHSITAVTIVILVLLQHGKGADMGATFGGGSQSLFGARGSASFLSRTTAVLACVFFITSMTLAYLQVSRQAQPTSVITIPAEQDNGGTEALVPEVDDTVPTIPE